MDINDAIRHRTVADVWNGLTEEQKRAVYTLAGCNFTREQKKVVSFILKHIPEITYVHR